MYEEKEEEPISDVTVEPGLVQSTKVLPVQAYFEAKQPN